MMTSRSEYRLILRQDVTLELAGKSAVNHFYLGA